MLGNIKAAYLTKKQLKDTITGLLIKKNLLYEPIVSIRYLNYKVVVLGEVARPSVINVPGEKIALLEALGLAGDLTPYANRNEILIIREDEAGKRITKRLDLSDKDLFTSSYYYLKSNDIVYVAPNKAKAASTSTTKQWLPVVISSMSFIAVVIGQIVK
jgi:polysaccharide export outer membrane protein